MRGQTLHRLRGAVAKFHKVSRYQLDPEIEDAWQMLKRAIEDFQQAAEREISDLEHDVQRTKRHARMGIII